VSSGIDQIDDLIEQVRNAGLPVQHDVMGIAAEPLPAGLQLAAYRIVQEALTNTLKHAGAGAKARVALTFEADGVQIEVTDSGPERWPAATEGVGLRGMRERAAVYDGVVDAGPLEGGGWRVRTWLMSAAVPAEAAPA
jgi:signal transduction histidine kinase